LKLSQAPSKHQQWSQEIRWAGTFSSKLSAVFGVFVFGQNLKSTYQRLIGHKAIFSAPF
jgi:iron complex outermembrane receptor protein